MPPRASEACAHLSPPAHSPHCHCHRLGGRGAHPSPGPPWTCPRAPLGWTLLPQSLGRPLLLPPFTPTQQCPRPGPPKGQHPDQPSVRRPCVVGRLSRPKLRSTAIVGGRRACGLGGELRLGWGASPTPAVTPGLQGLNPAVCRLPTSTCTPHIVLLSQPVLHPPFSAHSSGRLCFGQIPGPGSLPNEGKPSNRPGGAPTRPRPPPCTARNSAAPPAPCDSRPSASVGPALSPPWLAPPIFLAEAALGSRAPLPSPSVRLHLPQERGGGSGPRMSAAPGDGP